MITVLAGGVGAARFLQGVIQIVPQADLVVIGNTGDDKEFYGLYVSPDLDIVTYTLAGVVNEQTGWGIKDDTFFTMNQLTKMGYEDWFKIGDKDFATHILRTDLLSKGQTLTEVTEKIMRYYGLNFKLLPMSNDPVSTHIVTPEGRIHFQEYMVKHKTQDEVLGIEFIGLPAAKPAPGVLDCILRAEIVIVAPSNPLVSIGSILSVSGVKEALKSTSAKVVAVSPIVGGMTIKGPADKMMRGLGMQVSAVGVAEYYRDFLDAIIIDNTDMEQKNEIERMGIKALATDTLMKNLEIKKSLAKKAIDFNFESA